MSKIDTLKQKAAELQKVAEALTKKAKQTAEALAQKAKTKAGDLKKTAEDLAETAKKAAAKVAAAGGVLLALSGAPQELEAEEQKPTTTKIAKDKESENDSEFDTQIFYDINLLKTLTFLRGFKNHYDAKMHDIGASLPRIYVQAGKDSYYELPLMDENTLKNLRNKSGNAFDIMKKIVNNMSNYQLLQQSELYFSQDGRGRSFLSKSNQYVNLNKQYKFNERQNITFSIMSYFSSADLTKFFNEFEANKGKNVNNIFSKIAKEKTSIDGIAVMYWLNALYTGAITFDTITNMKAGAYEQAITNGKSMTLEQFKNKVFDPKSGNFKIDKQTIEQFVKNGKDHKLKTKTVNSKGNTPYVGDIMDFAFIDKTNPNSPTAQEVQKQEKILADILKDNGYKPQQIKVGSPLFEEEQVEMFNVLAYETLGEACDAFMEQYGYYLLASVGQSESFFTGLHYEGTSFGIASLGFPAGNGKYYYFKLTNFKQKDSSGQSYMSYYNGKYKTKKVNGQLHTFLTLDNGKEIDGNMLFDEYFSLVPDYIKLEMVRKHLRYQLLPSVMKSARAAAKKAIETKKATNGNVPVRLITGSVNLGYQLPSDGMNLIDNMVSNPDANAIKKIEWAMNYTGDNEYQSGSNKRRNNNSYFVFGLTDVPELLNMDKDSQAKTKMTHRQTIYTQHHDIVDILGNMRTWWKNTHTKKENTGDLLNTLSKEEQLSNEKIQKLKSLEKEIVVFIEPFMKKGAKKEATQSQPDKRNPLIIIENGKNNSTPTKTDKTNTKTVSADPHKDANIKALRTNARKDLDAGRYGAAIKKYNEITAQDKNNAEAHSDLALAHIKYAKNTKSVAEQKKHYEAACKAINLGLATNPDDNTEALLYYNAGLAREELGQIAENNKEYDNARDQLFVARNNYREANKISPSSTYKQAESKIEQMLKDLKDKQQKKENKKSKKASFNEGSNKAKKLLASKGSTNQQTGKYYSR